MSKFCCNTDLIWFMIKESEKLMKGYVHEDNFFIVHDALVLITAKETITWMKDKKYFNHSFLPINGFLDGTPYDVCPVGNNPEIVPLDNILNRDILHSLRFYCVLSRFLIEEKGTDKEERNMRFRLSTPKEITQGLKRIRE